LISRTKPWIFLSVINTIAFMAEEDMAEHAQMSTAPKIAIAFIGAVWFQENVSGFGRIAGTPGS
jgi:hypothetical protein